MNKPILLDLYCGAGGAAAGYIAAGFDVIGVDIDDQPNYPGQFVRANALEVLDGHIAPLLLDAADAVHASPPCQAHTTLTKGTNRALADRYPDLIEPTRERLRALGFPSVMENVPGAPLRKDLVLCGQSFGLKLYRHRIFELDGFTVTAPAHTRHTARCARNGYLPTDERPYMSIHGGKHSDAWRRAAADAMGMPWTRTQREITEAIPPAYTRHIGTALRRHLEQA